MNKKDFNELLGSLNEAVEISKGNKKPSRVFTYTPLDIKAIRNKTKYSQQKFAELIGVKTNTLQNWEQGRREPTGPAKVLLKVLDENPDAVFEAVHHFAH